MPDEPKAGVILISGSGPQNRDQLFMGHRPFWVIADQLTKQGIAVLRYDDRGVADSEGNFDTATSYDFAEDASGAINFLQQVDKLKQKSVGVIGHSEGGLIAPVLASINQQVAFAILLAGPSRTGKFVSENQMIKILLSNGVSKTTAHAGSNITKALNNVVLNSSSLDKEALIAKLKLTYQQSWDALTADSKNQLQRLGGGSLTQARIKMLTGDWYKVFLQHEPVTYLSTIEVPTLALFGEKDVQISTADHYPMMQQALLKSGHSSSQVHVLKDHNHMFQKSKTGAMSEYQQIEETISADTLSVMTQWILTVTNKNTH